jgi:hypothetical protein
MRRHPREAAADGRDLAAVRSFELAAPELIAQRTRAPRVVALLLLWAALAQVDEVTRGEAR